MDDVHSPPPKPTGAPDAELWQRKLAKATGQLSPCNHGERGVDQDSGREPEGQQHSPCGRRHLKVFDFIDGANIMPSQIGHMEKLIVNIADSTHHSEKWVLKTTDGKEMTENFELERKN